MNYRQAENQRRNDEKLAGSTILNLLVVIGKRRM
jgi:hypothetical protein